MTFQRPARAWTTDSKLAGETPGAGRAGADFDEAGGGQTLATTTPRCLPRANEVKSTTELGVAPGRVASSLQAQLSHDLSENPLSPSVANTHSSSTNMAPVETDREELTPWTLVYTEWDPREQPVREALCALGNGYLVTRGAAEEARAGGAHYPGTYLHGGYNRLESDVDGHVVENEDLVNWPNWLPLTFRPEKGDWFHVDSVKVLGFRQELDLSAGMLERRLRIRDGRGHETLIVSRRLVHMVDPHIAAIQWQLTPQNWSGAVEIRSGIDGSVANEGVKRYRGLAGHHIDVTETGHVGEDGIFLTARTVQSQLRMSLAARTRVYDECGVAPGERRTRLEDRRAEQRITTECAANKALVIEKLVAVHSTRDRAISEPQAAATTALRRVPRFRELETTHRRAWADLWTRADLELSGLESDEPQLALRLHVFHLLQTASMNTIDRDVGVPARGLHGEAYRGHIFWDELYVFPFLNLRFPELTRSLLMYRYRRLPEARWMAAASGYRGAMFPWQSGSDGREESQVLHRNPRSGHWIPDVTHRQRHVSAAIAFNVWQYFQATEDVEFLSFYGAEMVLSIARFWGSIAEYNPERERYEIHNVMGPDEYHTGYPDEEPVGLRNNAYTNVMASWCLRRARETLARMPEERHNELLRQLELGDEELDLWDDVASKMFVPMEDGIILQFEGWQDLEELDWDGYRRKYGDIQRLDRILEAEGDDVNRFKATKQADVLMLFFLFSREELQDLFEGIGYPFAPEMIPANIDYYLNRTSHGSTLSRVVHGWVMSRADRLGSWPLVLDALQSDLEDIQGGTTSEGIHLGAMAGTVDLMQRCYTGIEVRDDILWVNPRLPSELSALSCRIRYRGHWLTLRINHAELVVRFDQGYRPRVRVGYRDTVYSMEQGEERVFTIAAAKHDA